MKRILPFSFAALLALGAPALADEAPAAAEAKPETPAAEAAKPAEPEKPEVEVLDQDMRHAEHIDHCKTGYIRTSAKIRDGYIIRKEIRL